MTGFLEESEGVRSMTRLVAAALSGAVCICILTACAVALWKTEQALPVIGAIAGLVTPIVAGVWASLKVRT